MLLLKNANEIAVELAQRVRERRLERQLTQKGLAERSGVALGTLKRFEQFGKISLENLLKIALVLDCQAEFEDLFKEKPTFKTLDEALEKETKRQRGRIN